MDNFISVLKRYSDFNGRSSRSEYWYFVLFSFIISIAVSLLESMLGLGRVIVGYGLLSTIYSLVIILPSVAVAIRRLHDTNRSGWWILISVIPVVGWVWAFVLAVLPGTVGANEYGPEYVVAHAVTPTPTAEHAAPAPSPAPVATPPVQPPVNPVV